MSIKETAKGEAKEIAKSKIKKTIIRYCMPFIAIVLIACIFFAFIFGIANIIKDKLNDLKNKIVSWTSSLWYKDGIHIKNADVVDFIKTLETEGISISDLGMAADNVTVNNDETASEEDEDTDDKVTDEEKKSIKYIKKFMEASIASETIDTNHNGHGIAGCIKLKRDNARTGIVTDDIKYVDMDKIQDYENADYEKYYSLDDSGNLVIIVQNQNDGMVTYSTKTINYKSAVSQYTMPIMFFVDICMTTQNPEYVKALAQEVIDNTKIEITLEESSTIITTTTTTETHPADGDAGSNSVTSTSIMTQITPVITTVDELLYKLQQTYTKTVNTNISSQLGRAIHEDEGWTKTDSSTTTTIYTFQAGTELEPEIKYQKDDPFPKISKTKYYVPYYHGNIEAYSSLISGGDMLFEMMDSNMDNDTLEQVLKYVLYKISRVNFGVTELDPNLLIIKSMHSMVAGSIDVNSCNLTREEFIQCINDYASKSGYANYNERFGQYAGLIYDICTSKNINPILCATQARTESVFGKAVPVNSPWNYWGIGVYNDSNTGTYFPNIDAAITKYCDILLDDQKAGSPSYNDAQIYCQYNDKITADMSNIYDVYCSYMYLGKYHSGKMWGNVNVKNFLVNYLNFPCSHALSDETTYEEQAAYVVYYVDNNIIKAAQEIFGDKALNNTSAGDGSSIEDDPNLTDIQNRIVYVAKNSSKYGISANAGYCLKWADDVYQAAGATLNRVADAKTAGQLFGISSNYNNIKVGARVYGYSHSIYGHVGIYIGNGIVAHNIGYVAFDNIAQWWNKYVGFSWGWATKQPLV